MRNGFEVFRIDASANTAEVINFFADGNRAMKTPVGDLVQIARHAVHLNSRVSTSRIFVSLPYPARCVMTAILNVAIPFKIEGVNYTTGVPLPKLSRLAVYSPLFLTSRRSNGCFGTAPAPTVTIRYVGAFFPPKAVLMGG